MNQNEIITANDINNELNKKLEIIASNWSTSNGYVAFSNGISIQWGTASGNKTLPYAAAPYAVSVDSMRSNYDIYCTGTNSTGFTVNNSGADYRWFAFCKS